MNESLKELKQHVRGLIVGLDEEAAAEYLHELAHWAESEAAMIEYRDDEWIPEQ